MRDTSADDVILLVEDAPSLQMIYAAAVRRAGLTVECCSTAAEALAAFARLRPRVVLLDLVLPDGTGLEVMREMLRQAPQTCVIVITANASINKAVEMMRAGAYEFLVKPFDDQRLMAAIENARRAVNHRLPPVPQASDDGVPAPFIGRSPAMQAVYSKIRSVMASSTSSAKTIGCCACST